MKGRRALVTGGGRGIGRAIGLELAAAGADVAVLARSAAEVEAVAAQVSSYGVRGTAVTADVSDGGALAAAVGRVGEVDVLVLNHGVVWPLGRSREVDPDEWERSVAVNLVGAFRCVRLLLPGMVDRGWGRIVAITSGAASPPGMPSASAYSVAKAGLEQLVASLAAELAGTGVTALSVRPGVVDTPMQDYMRGRPRTEVGDAFADRFGGLHSRGELLDPAVPARLVVRLLGTELTGEVVDVRSERGRELLR